MVNATEKHIYLTRHAQAEHNVDEDYSIPDAKLTTLGREQAAALHAATQTTIQTTAELLVTSALRRTLSTTAVGYAALKKRLEESGKPVIALPQLQECNNVPCDIGSPREILEATPEYAGVDFSALTPDWTSKTGFYAPDAAALAARARWVRRWLRARPERDIVVVAHADVLRYIVYGHNTWQPWANVEVRECTFTVDEADDTDGGAALVVVGKVAQEGENAPTSASAI